MHLIICGSSKEIASTKYFMYYVKDLFPGKDIIISYRNAILRIMLRSFQISVILASVKNILKKQCEHEVKRVS